jgi:hypothetical protein
MSGRGGIYKGPGGEELFGDGREVHPISTCPHERLEYLRAELRAERISFGELLELQSLAKHIDPSDVELLEAAGVPEFDEDAVTPSE